MTNKSFDIRPTCINLGCNNNAKRNKSNGKYYFHKECSGCINEDLAIRKGYESAWDMIQTEREQIAIENGFACYKDYKKFRQEILAKEKGFSDRKHYIRNQKKQRAESKGFASVTEHMNQYNPRLKNRKKYCENIDGRLGFVCTTTITMDAMLDVDHIFPKAKAKLLGWSEEKIEHADNYQTLCRCCHVHKTIKNGDGKLHDI